MHIKVYKSLELRRKKVRLRGEELTHKSLKEFWSAVSRKAQSTLKFSLHFTRASCFQSRSQIRLHRVKNLKDIWFLTPGKPQTRTSFRELQTVVKSAPDQVLTTEFTVYITYRFIQLHIYLVFSSHNKWTSISTQ